MNETDSLLNFFQITSKIKVIRSNQKEALDKLWVKLNNGITKISVSAPVGAGKGALGNTLFNYRSVRVQGRT